MKYFSEAWFGVAADTVVDADAIGGLSGNLVEEVGALGEKNDGAIAVQIKDYDDKTVTGTIDQ